ncbi:hypothetical protein EXIGLDRAFT_730546 [Exidia glandulosa HHB12029]|uniref:Uncharacterized protein n=1 Tax=Exidia glandulosa HHB12029 TaxID=1314781 RepID=A0A165ZDZ2_EXIGL|nr:hypothetical protein EXIGLDRAFT_730546 [Exidia glandulosa HHB12029]
MADPVGLASLGVGGIKKVLRHGTKVRARRRDIGALSLALDKAHALLTTSHHDAPETYRIHEEVLAPLINEVVLFLDSVSARERYQSVLGKYVRPGHDSVSARRLLAALEASPAHIKSRLIDEKLSLTQLRVDTIPEVLAEASEKQREALHNLLRGIILWNSFFH